MIAPTTTQLRSFIKAVDCGTFVRAALELGISQPSLSRHIKALEDGFAVRLFDRDTRKIVLSASGRELLPICRRMLAELDTGISEMSDIAAGRRGRIAIAALPSVASALLPKAVPALKADHPDVEIRLVDGTLLDVEIAVAQGHADLGLTAEPWNSDYLRFTKLFDDPMVALLPRGMVPADREAISWAELAEMPFVAIKARTSIRRMADVGFAQAQRVVSAAFEVAFVKTAATLVASRLGVTAIPKLYLSECIDLDVVHLPLEGPRLGRSVGIVTAVDRVLSPAAQILIGYLTAAAE